MVVAYMVRTRQQCLGYSLWEVGDAYTPRLATRNTTFQADFPCVVLWDLLAEWVRDVMGATTYSSRWGVGPPSRLPNFAYVHTRLCISHLHPQFHTFLGLLAQIMCSICSYKLNRLYGSH